MHLPDPPMPRHQAAGGSRGGREDAEQLRAAAQTVRNQAAVLNWRSPGAGAFEEALAVALAELRRAAELAEDCAQAAGTHRRAVQDQLERAAAGAAALSTWLRL
jgi:hypothetical protein